MAVVMGRESSCGAMPTLPGWRRGGRVDVTVADFVAALSEPAARQCWNSPRRVHT